MKLEMKSTEDAQLPQPSVVPLSDPELGGVDPVPDDAELMSRQHADEEVTDYDDGFKAGFKGSPNDEAKSQAWQRGWAEAQE
jgi:hypothetical protein